MQWDSSRNAGFSSGKPWMRVNNDYTICNARQQQEDKTSVLAYWKKMLSLRKQFGHLFVYGEFDMLDAQDEKLFSFTKTWRGQQALVTLNFTEQMQPLQYPDAEVAELLAGTVDASKPKELQPFEGRIYLLPTMN